MGAMPLETTDAFTDNNGFEDASTPGEHAEVLGNSWCARQELNLRPAGSKPDALSN
jgi:hypothetical protein